MKLYSLSILYRNPSDSKALPLKCAHDVSSFGYFQRNSVREFMEFSSRVIVERTAPCTRSATKEQQYVCHVCVRQDGLAGVVISDQEYNIRVAQALLSKVLDEFASKVSQTLWTAPDTSLIKYDQLASHLEKYQNPSEADALTRLQQDLDETKIILHDTLDKVLQRGEKLDDLVAKSDDLSNNSKMFYKTAKKTNSCCTIL